MHVDVLVPAIPNATEGQRTARASNLQDMNILTKGLQHKVVLLPSPLGLLAYVKVWHDAGSSCHALGACVLSGCQGVLGHVYVLQQPKDPSVTSLANLELEVGASQGTAAMIIPVKLSKKTARETLPSLQRCV